MPKYFKGSKPSTRVIVDCTVFIEKPSPLHSQSINYSNYKHHNKAKNLIGIAPFATVTFVSELFAVSRPYLGWCAIAIAHDRARLLFPRVSVRSNAFSFQTSLQIVCF